jgi:hypothetical protein
MAMDGPDGGRARERGLVRFIELGKGRGRRAAWLTA